MEDRLFKLDSIIKGESLDVIFLTDGYNMHYLSGFSGHCGMLLVINDKKFGLTDSRYTEAMSIEAPMLEVVDIKQNGYSKTLSQLILENCGLDKKGKIRIGFENQDISYSQFMSIKKCFDEEFGERYVLCELGGKINELRMQKSMEEIERLEIAEKIGDDAFSHIVNYIRPGMTEKQIALELEYTMKKLGADGLSFDTIVASGSNSSLPHAVPTDRKVQDGDFITMDFGCIYKGYCSDMTRTVFVGKNPSEKQQFIYDTVLKAQQESLKLIKPGMKCSDVDACARNIIKEAGFGDFFGHGLGHSVGLFIHEEPRLSPKCDVILKPGMILTCEPGIYLPGEFGVRIEDMVVVTKDGYKNLTASTKSLIYI